MRYRETCLVFLSTFWLLAGCQGMNEQAIDITQPLFLESAVVAAADFNQDGHQDLVAGGEKFLTIFLGDGRGNLTSASRVPGGEQPDDFAIADLDEDGDLDIVVANHDTNYLTLLLGNGDGSFQPAPNSPLHINVSPHPHVVRAVDLDEDGYLDLVVDHRDGEGVLQLRGTGGGRFVVPGTLVGVGGDPYRGMALGDLNRDGKIDIVTPNPRDVGVLLNISREETAFELAPPVPAAAPFAVGLGDFNNDGLLDLLAASDEGSRLVELYIGDGRAGFQEANGSPFELAPGGKNIVIGDFNGDGVDDGAVASYLHPEVLVLFGGKSTFTSVKVLGGENPWGLVAADFNEDGADDLLVVDDATGEVFLYMSLGQTDRQ